MKIIQGTMDLLTIIKLSLNSLRRQRTRSVLTILGISVGIAIVIVIMSAGRGLSNMITGELDIYSPDSIFAETTVPGTKHMSAENAMEQSTGITVTTLKMKDVKAVAGHPNITEAQGWVMSQDTVSRGGANKLSLLYGLGYNALEIQKTTIDSGRFFTEEEDKSLAQVAVIGATVREKLFGDSNPLGENIYIKGKPFKVIGTQAPRGSAFFMDMDNVVMIPVLTAQKRLLGVDYLHAIVAKMKDPSKGAETVQDLTEILRIEHDITDPNKDDFTFTTMEQARGMLDSVMNAITFLLVALVCISLVVGGVGIMNIMYVSVAERTFEIGLRKALGAKKADILWQFLGEAIMVTTAGGVVGIIIGALLSLLIYIVAVYYKLNWAYSIPISSVIISVGFSAFIGLLFGLYPARKAANLDPIEAIRRE